MKFLGLLAFLPVIVVHGLIKGFSYYGLETPHKGFVCDWVHPPAFYLKQLTDHGFNSVRVPFSRQWVLENDFSKLDSFLEDCKQYPNLTVMLDLHRTWTSHQGEFYEGGVSLTDYADAWITMGKRYASNPQITTLDLYNEPQTNDAMAVVAFYRQLTVKIEEVIPGRFHYSIGCPQWGGNCHDVSLEDLSFSDRISYTIHRYSFSGGQSEANWDWAFGNLTHKMTVGEWSWKNDNPSQREWALRFIEYLKRKNIKNGWFWTVSASGDTGNLFADDCESFDEEKMTIIKTLWEDRRSLRGLVSPSVLNRVYHYNLSMVLQEDADLNLVGSFTGVLDHPPPQ